mmetsp:Transcript_36069/g.81858  ORF Transcript_36069/g.81858 Transcript_36069/m.81858 type:complete len:415 (+) Transcript_36069:720-1964(+)
MGGCLQSSTVWSVYVPAATVLNSSAVLTNLHVPSTTTPAAKATLPSTVIFLHLMSDGGPLGTMAAILSTNLKLSSSFTVGGTPARSAFKTMRASLVISYASDASARRSAVVFTGAKRERGMRIACAPSKHSIAEPIAVSSCSTLVDALSRGSTVLPLLMTGRGIKPPNFSNVALSASRFTQRLFVLKNLCLVTSWKASASSSGHWASSRSSSPPFLPRARWPPFLSASVRAATSIANGAPLPANHVSSFTSIVAPRLSEFDTNMYLKPLASSVSSVPEPTSAGYRSPWPGGHHSSAGFAGQLAGVRSDLVTFGALFCKNSSDRPAAARVSYLESASSVSAEVEKEFISMKASSTPKTERMCSTCRAMKSRKVAPSFRGSRLFAFSSPIPVPRPPLSLSITVLVNSAGSSALSAS